MVSTMQQSQEYYIKFVIIRYNISKEDEAQGQKGQENQRRKSNGEGS